MAKKEASKEDLLALFCFHAQQSAEKALKAVLIANDREPPRTHDIGFLLKCISDFKAIPEELIKASTLTIYAVSTRYPEDEEDVTESELTEAIVIAEQVFHWARKVCGD